MHGEPINDKKDERRAGAPLSAAGRGDAGAVRRDAACAARPGAARLVAAWRLAAALVSAGGGADSAPRGTWEGPTLRAPGVPAEEEGEKLGTG
eukprot:6084888-Heterocapsa_arctica.AAC.1